MYPLRALSIAAAGAPVAVLTARDSETQAAHVLAAICELTGFQPGREAHTDSGAGSEPPPPDGTTLASGAPSGLGAAGDVPLPQAAAEGGISNP